MKIIKKFEINGITGELAENINNNWLIGLRQTNPAILDMFAERDIRPYRDLLPWSGEFAGKYITGAYYIYKLTYNEDLYSYILKFIDELITYQDTDGYLGCYQKDCRLTGAFSQSPDKTGETWDAWAHYHIMYGLMLWYEETGKEEYINVIYRIADLFINKFYNNKPNLVSIGWAETNLAPYHMFAKLYRVTKDEKYLKFAKLIEDDLSDERAGNYINHALNGLEYYQCPKPRWESMHIIAGIAEMYKATGDEKYLQAVKQIVYSILKTDIHNTGGFSTKEEAIGTPFADGAIETCCVIAYNALVIEILDLVKDIKLIDFLELSHYNAVMGSFSPSGHWSTYDTPMDGTRNANFHQIWFQCRSGSPELNCCSVNAPRGVGMLSEWAITNAGNYIDENILYIHFFEQCKIITNNGVSIEIDSEYPANGNVKIRLKSENNQKIAIRIPLWSKNTTLKLNGQLINVEAGSYAYLSKHWNDNDQIEIIFDFTVYFLHGKEKYEGKSSIYYGPLLYGCDLALNKDFDFNNLPELTLHDLQQLKPQLNNDGRITVKLPCGIILSDFYRLGCTGSEYKTWLNVIK